MTKEVVLKEPVHPEALVEYEQRLGLAQCMQAEIGFMRLMAKETRNPEQKETFLHQAAMLERILVRWTEGADYEIFTENGSKRIREVHPKQSDL